MCSDSDYNKMLKFLLDQFSYNEDRKVSSILWHDINIKLEKKDYIIGILSIIIISIPIIIKICLMIIKYISRKRNKKSKKINKLLDGKNMTKFQSYSENEFKTNRIYTAWHSLVDIARVLADSMSVCMRTVVQYL